MEFNPLTERVLLILKSLGVNYPVISSWGFRFTKPLALFVDDGQTQYLVNILSNFDIHVVNECMCHKNVTEFFINCSSDYIFYPLSYTKKAGKLLEYLEIIIKQASVQNGGFGVIPLVICEGRLLEDSKSNLFFVNVEGCLKGYDLSLSRVVPSDDQLVLVKDKIRDISMDGSSPEEQALLAAACFLWPYLREKGQEKEFSNLLKTARLISEKDDDSHEVNDMGGIFIRTLYLWQEKENFSDIFGLPELEEDVINRLDEVLLFDGKYIYMPDKIFRMICSPMLRIFPMNVIKTGLVNCEILVPENERTYTCKVGFYNYAGFYKRVRALRLNKERLDRIGALGFVDTCLLTRKEK